jgi:S-adenosylmethionine:tRNA-ribosyltransferase-isomerase (queuine synthetase)
VDDYKLIEEHLTAISQRLDRIETTLTENNAQTLRSQVKLEDIEKQILHLQGNDAVLFNENKVIREQLVPKRDINVMFDKIRSIEKLPMERSDKIVRWVVRILVGAAGTVLTGGLIAVFVKLAALLK